MAAPNLEWGIATSQGTYAENDDYGDGRAFDDYQCFILCDGLGGHKGGALAARMLTTALLDMMPASIGGDATLAGEILSTTINSAARKMRVLVLAEDSNAQPHTTCVAALVHDDFILSAHVGDSRLYCVRDGMLEWRSRDHSVARLVEELGDTSGSVDPRDETKLYRTLNGQKDVKVSLTISSPLSSRDGLVLCTDGFWGVHEDDEIADLITRDDTQFIAESAVGAVRNNDDATVLIIRRQ